MYSLKNHNRVWLKSNYGYKKFMYQNGQFIWIAAHFFIFYFTIINKLAQAKKNKVATVVFSRFERHIDVCYRVLTLR